MNGSNRKELYLFFSSLKLPVLQIPSIDELVSGKEKINNLKPISIEDILGRTSVAPDMILLEKTINKLEKLVMSKIDK